MSSSLLPKVVIIGRTNVGKSTLFNRLISQKKALVSDIAGTTRDRNIATCEWRDFYFELIDTGGLDIADLPMRKATQRMFQQKMLREMEQDVLRQTQIALKQADLALFVLDGTVGILPEDRTVLHLLRNMQKPFLVVVNKMDNSKRRKRGVEFEKLGVGETMLVSALNGVGSGDLLDAIVQHIAKIPSASEDIPEIRVAIVGKPNVGKSSLLNAILGENRVIVSPIPHTTRESHDTLFTYKTTPIRLIDTAGLRRLVKSPGRLETMGIKRTLATLKRCDVALFLLDVSAPPTIQDQKIGEILAKLQTPTILVANKWDLIPDKTPRSMGVFSQHVLRFFPQMKTAALEFVSAKTSEKVPRLLSRILAVFQDSAQEISDDVLRDFLSTILKQHAPKRGRGKRAIKIYALKQISKRPPRFQLLVDDDEKLHHAYLRFLENALAQAFNFRGVSVKITVKDNG